MKTPAADKCSDKTKPDTEIRMGREVPVLKKATGGDSTPATNGADKSEKPGEKPHPVPAK